MRVALKYSGVFGVIIALQLLVFTSGYLVDAETLEGWFEKYDKAQYTISELEWKVLQINLRLTQMYRDFEVWVTIDRANKKLQANIRYLDLSLFVKEGKVSNIADLSVRLTEISIRSILKELIPELDEKRDLVISVFLWGYGVSEEFPGYLIGKYEKGQWSILPSTSGLSEVVSKMGWEDEKGVIKLC